MPRLVFACLLTATAAAFAADPRRDRDGEPLPAEAVQRLGSARFLVNNLAAAAFSPDGKTVYTISEEDDTSEHYDFTSPGLIAWEVPIGRKLWQVGVDRQFEQVVADPDGKSVWVMQYVGATDLIRHWDRVRYSANDGRELSRVRLDLDDSCEHVLNSNGAIAAYQREDGYSSYCLMVWDSTGKQVIRHVLTSSKLRNRHSLMWAPSGDRQFVRTWNDNQGHGYGAAFDVSTAKILWQYENPAQFDWQVSPDGKWLVGHSLKATVHRWNAETGKEDASLKMQDLLPCGELGEKEHGIPEFHFLPGTDIVLVMSGWKKYVALDWRQWKPARATLNRPWNAVYTLDRTKYLVDSGRNVLIYDTKTDQRLSPNPGEFTRVRWGYKFYFSPTNDRLTRRSLWGPQIEWSLATGQELKRTSWEEIAPLIGTEDGNRSYGPDCNEDGICLSPDGGKKLTQVWDKTKWEWHGTITSTIRPNDPPVILSGGWKQEERYYGGFCFTADGRQLIGFDDPSGLHIWDAVKGGPPRDLRFERWDWENYNRYDVGVFPSRDSRFVAVIERHGRAIEDFPESQAIWRVGVYSLEAAKKLAHFDGIGELTSLGWTDHGKVVGVANRSPVAVPTAGKFDLICLDAHAKTMRVRPIGPGVRAWAVAPFGDMVAVGSSDGLRLYEASTGKLRHRFREQTRPVELLAFSPNGRYLAAESVDGPVLLWDVRGDLTKPAKPDAAGWHSAWDTLGETGAEAAFRAVRLFALYPDDGLPELTKRFAELKRPSEEALTALIRELGDRDYSTSERAEKELKKLGFAAFSALKNAAAENPSAEVQERASRLLAVPTPADLLRAERAVEAVRLADTAAGRKLLVGWANGAPDDPLTAAAKRTGK